MKRNIILLLSFIVFLSAKAQTKASVDSIAQRNLFQSLKPEFEKFEKQHGNYIQTNNVKMHYLEWGNKKNPLYNFVYKV